MTELLNSYHMNDAILPILELGLNHEQQHQELLITDIKYILGHNPLFPAYKKRLRKTKIYLVKKECFIFQREFMKSDLMHQHFALIMRWENIKFI